MTYWASFLLAQADHIPVPPPPAASTLEIGGLLTFATGFLTVLGTQVVKPWLESHYADRRHKREMDALGMANDLKLANERNTLLMKQVTLLQEQVAELQAEVTAFRAHWKDESPPPQSGTFSTALVPPVVDPGGKVP